MVASGQQRAGRPAPLRLTRRGWVVLLMLLVIAASLLGALLATASQAAGPVPMIPVSQVVVEPHATGWSILDGAILDGAGVDGAGVDGSGVGGSGVGGAAGGWGGIPFRGVPETFSGRYR